MTKLTLEDALTRARSYAHAVLSFVDADGYPIAVASPFETDEASSTIELGPVRLDARPSEACVTFSHIRPRRGYGYDQRRYVNVWGSASMRPDGRVLVRAERASGWDEDEVPFFEYSERNVGRARAYLESLGTRPRLSAWWTFFLATRLPFLTATIVPVALGAAVAARHGSFSLPLFGLTLLAAICVHLGLNVANDLFDDASGADAANFTPTPFSGGSRVIQHGLVSRRAMVAMCAAFYAAAIAIGVWLAATRGPALYAIGAAGVALSLAYTAPPFRLVHRGLGEPVTALGFGPVMALGAYYVLAQRLSWEAAVVSVPVGILIALVLYVNQVPDREGDAAAGKRTLVVRLSKSSIVRGYLGAAIAAYAVIALAALTVAPAAILAALVTLPLAVRVWRGLREHYERPYELMAAMQSNIVLHLATGLLLVAGYVADVLL